MINFDFKIKIDNLDDRIRFQKILFKLGYRWESHRKTITCTECNTYLVSTNIVIYYLDGDRRQSNPLRIYTTDVFQKEPFIEITYNEFLKLTGNKFQFGR